MGYWKNNSCCLCKTQLAPDDFDGICADCDSLGEEHEFVWLKSRIIDYGTVGIVKLVAMALYQLEEETEEANGDFRRAAETLMKCASMT